MNEFKRYNLAGIQFAMDNDAYEALDAYLESLKKAYDGQPGKNEIIADIEGRIAELILSAQNSQDQVIARPLIENIIRQMGSADDISGSRTEPKAEASIPRRLYRDGANAKIGGVCAGIARYFNVDSAAIRISVFLPLFLAIILPEWHGIDDVFGNIFMAEAILYILMWFAVPKAVTPRQKMEMDGERITSATIAGYGQPTVDEKAQKSVAGFVAVLGFVCMILLKCFIVLLLFPAILSLIGMIAAIVAIIAGSTLTLPGFGWITGVLTPSTACLGIAFVAIPLAAVIYLFISLLISRKPKAQALLAMLGLWILVSIFLVIGGIRMGRSMDMSDMAEITDNLTELTESIPSIVHTSTTTSSDGGSTTIRILGNGVTVHTAGQSVDIVMSPEDSLSYMEAVGAVGAESIDR